MIIKKPLDINPSEITPERLYMTRRDFLDRASKVGITGGLATTSLAGMLSFNDLNAAISFKDVNESPYSTDEDQTLYEHATTYNNFYEFGTAKDDPANNSGNFNPLPWSIEVAGLCAKPGTYDLEDFIKPGKLEERIYRLRCVEAWSMVIPWLGVPLGDILKKFEPGSDAKYVAFTTVHRPEEMPGQKRRSLKWPYVEGLRLDEAMNPLSILAVGMYGRELPNQNGAPLRLVVPWKYGFKSIPAAEPVSEQGGRGEFAVVGNAK